MALHRNKPAHIIYSLAVQPCRCNAGSIRGAGDDLSPRIANQRVAETLPGLAAGGKVTAPLAARGEIDLELDGACPAKDLPMILSGLHREGSRQNDQIDLVLGKLIEQARKPEVVADGGSDPEAASLVDKKVVPWCDRDGLAIGLAVGSHDVEKMNLAIAADFPAFGIEHNGGVVYSLFPGNTLEHAAGMEP